MGQTWEYLMKLTSTLRKHEKKHSNVPNPKSNPIVVNNIASQEFDYTENPLKN